MHARVRDAQAKNSEESDHPTADEVIGTDRTTDRGRPVVADGPPSV